MSNPVIYVIIYTILFLTIYTIVIATGYYKSVQEHRRVFRYLEDLKSVITEIKNIVIHKEEKTMKEERNKEFKFELTPEGRRIIEAQTVKNKLSLADLITTKPTEENYEEIMALLTEVAQKTYEQYKFFIARSQDETEQPNFLQIVSHSSELPELHKLIFSRAVNYGIDMQELQKRFAHRIAENKVIDIGEDAIVIVDDNTNQLPTGVSPINSGLEGGEITFIISFMKKDNFGKWFDNTFSKDEGNE
jgi:hypothetical protein